MKHLKKIIFGIITVVPIAVLAATTEDMPEYDLTIQSLFAIINGLVCWASRLAYLIMVIMLVFYGLMFFKSQGEPAEYEKAKKGLRNAMIGILIILATYTIIATVASAVGVEDVSSFLPLSC